METSPTDYCLNTEMGPGQQAETNRVQEGNVINAEEKFHL